MSLDIKTLSQKLPATVVRARVVLPVSRPPIENGAVVIIGNRIHSIGSWAQVTVPKRARIMDLGEMVLLPGLVNAHCHLDYTAMAGQLAPTKQFIDWLKLITMSKSGWGYSDFAESWLSGAKMLLRTGTTTVGDIEMVPELLPDAWTATPLRVFSFLEMTGVKSRRLPLEILGEALAKISSFPVGSRRMGLSPHAPYSTTPELLHLTADAARHLNLPVMVHVAESDQEFEMFMYGEGKMFEWLARDGRNMSDCGHGSPVQHLERHGLLGKNLLAVHLNYLAPKDVALLAKRQVNVVHCPRSHTYFRHRRFALGELVAAGVNVCLGTDSLASMHLPRKQVAELSLFEEMRELAMTHPEIKPETLLQMATKNAAAALGMQKQIGELIPDALADLIAIPYSGKITDAPKAVVQHRGNVAASMIGGNWAIEPLAFST